MAALAKKECTLFWVTRYKFYFHYKDGQIGKYKIAGDCESVLQFVHPILEEDQGGIYLPNLNMNLLQ